VARHQQRGGGDARDQRGVAQLRQQRLGTHRLGGGQVGQEDEGRDEDDGGESGERTERCPPPQPVAEDRPGRHAEHRRGAHPAEDQHHCPRDERSGNQPHRKASRERPEAADRDPDEHARPDQHRVVRGERRHRARHGHHREQAGEHDAPVHAAHQQRDGDGRERRDHARRGDRLARGSGGHTQLTSDRRDEADGQLLHGDHREDAHRDGEHAEPHPRRRLLRLPTPGGGRGHAVPPFRAARIGPRRPAGFQGQVCSADEASPRRPVFGFDQVVTVSSGIQRSAQRLKA
jgi:hypothetical protein